MERIYGIFDDNMTIQCVFKTEEGAIKHCIHMNKGGKDIGLPDEFYVSNVTLHD